MKGLEKQMLEILKEIYSDLTGDYDTEITPKTKIDSDMDLSSLGKVQLICSIEDRFDVEIPVTEIRKFKTVKDIIKFLEKNA